MKASLRLYAVIASFMAAAMFSSEAEAASRKTACSIGFHVQVRVAENDPFSFPVKLSNPTRFISVERSPSISERQVSAIHVYPADDDSWGCLFQLDDSGRLALSNISASNRGRTIVFYLGNDKVTRPVLDILIDAPVHDGIINVPRGLNFKEAEFLKKNFPKSIKPREAR
jgi:hypothetical protein